MDVDAYIRVMRSHRVVIGLCLLAGVVMAGLIVMARPPAYQASVQLYGSAGAISSGEGTAYEGQRYTEQRMRSYATLLAGRAGAEAVRRRLNLSESVEGIRHKIRVSVPPNSSIATITARDASPQLAKAIAQVLAAEAPNLIAALESPARNERPPIQLSVINPAGVPTARIASKAVYLALGAVLGLLAGIGSALLRERSDDRIRSGDDASSAAAAPLLGTIAKRAARDPSPVMTGAPLSPDAEAYRSLRSHLVMAAQEQKQPKAFVVTSAVPGEGKTEVVANLGLALAQAGEKVAVVDANLRAPRLAALLDLPSEVGLTNLLAGTTSLHLALRRQPSSSLAVLPGGSASSSPVEMLESERWRAVLAELTDHFDWVLVDAPAVLAASDPLVLAAGTSGGLLVCRANSTGRRELREACQALRMVETEPIGVVLNRATPPHRNSRGGRGRALPVADRARPAPATSIEGSQGWSH
jgi:capsular exopolysaccharide synthesis family protein